MQLRPRLTRRQLEVLEAAARGETAHETARRLWVSVFTIQAHRKRLLYALGARNMTHAVALGYGLELLPKVEWPS
jgi:DNA-binding NarL/FixJ family response regulator